ncbi:MAG: alpha/beta fold hydrolase [Alphaproteobacteria bacterium]
MSGPSERGVEIQGTTCRVWEKGEGAPIGFLAGLGGLLSWTPFLDELAKSRRVIVPSLPGFPGGGRGHDGLYSHLDWLLATRDLLLGAGLDGADLVGVSAGGSLAAEMAAIWPDSVPRLVLISPLGIYDEADPVTDVWAQVPGTQGALYVEDQTKLEAVVAMPEGEDETEWQILTIRANEAAAQIFWPLSDTGLAQRLGRIGQPTLVLWGEADKVIAPSYAERVAGAIGPSATIRRLAGAGHLAEIDAPEAVAAAVLAHCD